MGGFEPPTTFVALLCVFRRPGASTFRSMTSVRRVTSSLDLYCVITACAFGQGGTPLCRVPSHCVLWNRNSVWTGPKPFHSVTAANPRAGSMKMKRSHKKSIGPPPLCYFVIGEVDHHRLMTLLFRKVSAVRRDPSPPCMSLNTLNHLLGQLCGTGPFSACWSRTAT